MAVQLDRLDRPTPESTVDAVLWACRERGLGGLRDPDTLERLRRCDDHARQRIDARLGKLLVAGLIPEVADVQ